MNLQWHTASAMNVCTTITEVHEIRTLELYIGLNLSDSIVSDYIMDIVEGILDSDALNSLI